jgi:hypothetical protein
MSAMGLGRVKTPDRSIDAARTRLGSYARSLFLDLTAFATVGAADADCSGRGRFYNGRRAHVGGGQTRVRLDCPLLPLADISNAS